MDFRIPDEDEQDRLRKRLGDAGFIESDVDIESGFSSWTHPAGMFPGVVVGYFDGPDGVWAYVKVDSVVEFLLAHGIRNDGCIGNRALSEYRTADVFIGQKATMCVIERHAMPMPPVAHEPFKRPINILRVSEMFRLRNREFESASEGFRLTGQIVDQTIKLVGPDFAADLFFAAEREYWMSRNRAAQVQYARQQKLGLGWANHDHHTYRSSREHFKDLIAIMEKLGLVCRERFYAGREAGWGAQVMEQPNAGIVVFADVDLLPEEVTGDFAHEPLPPRKELGTVGLWCALHGESFLEAGMHHLECQFDFHAQREQLKAHGVNSMKPFTDFDYLKQAFTEGEMWPVDARRIDALLRDGQITPEQAEKFRREGAIGSHLEVLQRDDGYKGFNQTGISEIIRDTDPRRVHGSSVAGA